jgi:hypothetical protein
MKAVVQKDPTGCALASVAVLTGTPYARVKRVGASLGLRVTDATLWSSTRPIQNLLAHFGIRAATKEKRFVSWEALPDRALLAIKWHREETGPAWHWVVFMREGEKARVFDSKKALRTNTRTDFGRMKPKWFIEIK